MSAQDYDLGRCDERVAISEMLEAVAEIIDLYRIDQAKRLPIVDFTIAVVPESYRFVTQTLREITTYREQTAKILEAAKAAGWYPTGRG